MSKTYSVRVWQNDVSVQWIYTGIKANSPEEAIKKYKQGEYTSDPEIIDMESFEGNDDDTAEAEEE